MVGVKKALIISISDYKDSELVPLEFCKSDGEKMYETLIKLGYEIPENQKIVGKASKKTVEDALINFFRKNISIDDTLLFYFSGHGVLDGYGGKYFSTTDIDTKIPEQDGVRFEMINEQMANSFVEKKIAILDCCFSGSAVPNTTGMLPGKAIVDLEKQVEDQGSEGLHQVFDKSQGSCILASSLSDKKSYPLADQSESAFTHFIIEGLKGTKDSVDENGFVTPATLSKYVFVEMQKRPELANQKPVRNLSIAGEIILAKHKNLARKPSSNSINSRLIYLLKNEKINEFNIILKENPNLQLILDDIDLTGKKLKGVNLQNAKLRNAKLDKSLFLDVNFSKAILVGASIQGSSFINVNLSGADLSRSVLSGSGLNSANLINSNLENSKLIQTNLTRANLTRANLTYADLTNAILQHTNLSNSNLTTSKCIGADFSFANLSGAVLSGAMLFGANFNNANMTSSILSFSKLAGADLSKANLSKVNLSYADLSGSLLIGTNLSEANLKNVDLSLVDLSETILTDVKV